MSKNVISSSVSLFLLFCFLFFTCVWRYHFRNKGSCVLCICAGNDAAVTEWMVSFKHFFKLVHCHVKFHSCSCIQHIHLRVGECPSLLLIKVTFQKLGVNRNNSKWNMHIITLKTCKYWTLLHQWIFVILPTLDQSREKPTANFAPTVFF